MVSSSRARESPKSDGKHYRIRSLTPGRQSTPTQYQTGCWRCVMDCEIVCYEEVKRAAQTAFWVSGTPRANSETVRFDNNKGRSAMKKLVIAVVAALAASSAWAIAIPQTFSGTAVGEWNDPVMES